MDFPNLVFTQADMLVGGSYVTERELTYRIHEKAPAGATDNGNGTWTKDGITSAPDVLVQVKLTDDGEGRITATYRGRDENGHETWLNTPINPQFVNTYQIVGEVRANLGAYKRLAGRAWQAGDSFAFKLKAVTKDAPMPDSHEMTVEYAEGDTADTKAGSFGDIVFTKPGAYVYEIEEIPGALPGVTYSTQKHRVTVTVEDDGKGGLKQPVVVYAHTQGSTPPTFENTYEAEGARYTPVVRKTMIGRTLGDGEYSFDLYAANAVFNIGDKLSDGTVDENGNGTLHTQIYTEPGTYYYVISEHLPEGVTDSGTNKTVKEGVTYSTHESKLTVVVVDDTAAGKLVVASATYDNADAHYDADKAVQDRAAFTNEYAADGEVEIKVTKAFNDEAGWDKADAFEFALTPVDGAPMRVKDGENVVSAERLTATATKDAREATFEKKLYFDLNDVGKKYSYEIKEIVPEGAIENRKNHITYNDTPVEVTVQVLDGGKGKLIFSTLYGGRTSATIQNTYETVTVGGGKTWVDGGRQHDNKNEVTLHLSRVSAKPGAVAEPLDRTPDWSGNRYSFTGLEKYDVDGYAYTYSVEEEPVQDYVTEKTGDFNFTNTITGTTRIGGTKRWVEAEDITQHTDNAEEVALVLSRVSKKDGAAEEAVADVEPVWNGSAYSFENLDKYDPEGYEYTYFVTEVPLAEYMTSYANPSSWVVDRAYDGGEIVNTRKTYPVRFEKRDLAGRFVPGARLQVLKDGKAVDEWTWESAGTVKTLNLPTGSYALHEIEAPVDYARAEDIPFTVGANGQLTVEDDV